MDSSAILPALVREPSSGSSDRFMLAHRNELLVSDFAAAELAAAFSRPVRTGVMPIGKAYARLEAFSIWREEATQGVLILNEDIRRTQDFVRQFDLMLLAPDALHAAICWRVGAALVTLDRRLARAALGLGIGVEAPA